MKRHTKRRKPPKKRETRSQSGELRRANPALRTPLTESSAFGRVLRFPFRVVGLVIKRTVQVLLSIFIVVLHPQFKWLLNLLLRSALVRNYIRPALEQIADRIYHPYFVFLRSLPPFWATLSIAVPLAVLEPAKLYATILVAERPKIGALLWLLLQGLSFILIDKTWTAVRPQSRKIWLVSRLHAWGWLNYAYGKYWITSSPAYQSLNRWLEWARRGAKTFWKSLVRSGNGRASSRKRPLG